MTRILYSMLNLFVQPTVVSLTPVFFTWLRFSSSHTRLSKSCQHRLVIVCHLCSTSAFCMILCPRYQLWLGWVMINHGCGVTLHICNCSESYFKSIPASPTHCITGGVQITVHLKHASGSGLHWFPLKILPFSFSLAYPSYPDMTLQEKKNSTLTSFADCLSWWYVIIKTI